MTSSGRPIAILGAMPEEISALLESLEDRSDSSVGGFEVHAGRLEGTAVLLAHCGVGKVNAAALTQVLMLQDARALIFTGVAGAVDPTLAIGDIVVSLDAIQHDVDVTALDYEPGRVPGEPLAWQADGALVKAAVGAAADLSEARVVTGRIASGDRFVADPSCTARLRELFDAACVEMEGGAVAQVCSRAGVPFVIIRSISDSADRDAKVSFREFTELAAGRAKRIVRSIVRELNRAPG
jgi:adenosylhomocysteine nucleosidase